MPKCRHFKVDPRGEATTDPKRRPGWYCQRKKDHEGWHEDYKADGSVSRRWNDAGKSPTEIRRETQARRQRENQQGAML